MKKEYLIPWWKTNLGLVEIEALRNAISKRYITQGVLTGRFERKLSKLLNVPYVLLTTNGSSALLVALMACGIKPGDEVVIPNVTFRATAQIPLLLGARIKLVDVESKRPLIDPKKIISVLSSKTKAIVPVHVNGRAANIKVIKKIAAQYGLIVIEDAAQALYARNRYGFLGAQSNVGVYSLAATKLITTVQGGIVVTRTKTMWQKMQEIRNYGISMRKASALNVCGFNAKYNDLFAAIGLSQIKEIKEKKRALIDVYNFYRKEIKNLNYMKIVDVDVARGEIPLWVEVLCVERDKVVTMLKKKGIEGKPSDPTISELFHISKRRKFKNSSMYAQYGMILPSGPGHSKEDLMRVVNVLKSIGTSFNLESVKEIEKLKNDKIN